MKWVTGDNLPGCLPDGEPVQHESWEDGWKYLCDAVEEAFLDGAPYVEGSQASCELTRYTTARDSLYDSRINYPLSVFYAGRVWWLADVPEGDLSPRPREQRV